MSNMGDCRNLQTFWRLKLIDKLVEQPSRSQPSITCGCMLSNRYHRHWISTMFDRNRTDFSADTSKLAVAIRIQLLDPLAARRNSVLLASMLMWAGSNVLAQDEPGKQVPPKSDSAKSQPNPSASGNAITNHRKQNSQR